MTDMTPSHPWSGLDWEELIWTPDESSPISRRARQEQTGPYWAAVPPSISGVAGIPLSPAAVADASEAAAEIARFDQEVGHAFAAYSTLFLRSESAASSQIEQLTASARSIGLAELGDTSRRNATAVVANVRTTLVALELADRLDLDAILAMHATLMRGEDPNRAGRWREEQVWVGGSSAGPRGALFIPPHHRHVGEAMQDLVAFMARDDLPVFAQVAVAHAQLETIHPFADGNGRTGRALIHALLKAKGLTRTVSVPVSAGLLTDTTTYFDALTAYRVADVDAIVLRFAEATFSALGNARQLMAEIEEIDGRWRSRLAARQDSSAWRLVDLVVRRPVIDIDVVTDELGVSRPTAYAAIEHLERAHVIAQVRGERRYRRWAATEVLEALDAFAERAGRRRGVSA